MSKLGKFHTPCKKCAFAKYDGNTQTDCYVGLLEEYRKTDFINIVEAFDEEKEFYIVNNKQCAAYREPKYFVSRNMEEATIDEKVSYIKDKLKIKYILIIDSSNIDLDTIADIIEKTKRSEVQPSCIMICVYDQSKYDFNDYYKVLHKSGVRSAWKIKNVSCEDQTHITTVHQVINLGAENCNFVLSVSGDYSDIDKVINTANDITYKKFDRFFVISNRSKETILFNKFVYKSALAHSADIITRYEDYTII